MNNINKVNKVNTVNKVNNMAKKTRVPSPQDEIFEVDTVLAHRVSAFISVCPC